MNVGIQKRAGGRPVAQVLREVGTETKGAHELVQE